MFKKLIRAAVLAGSLLGASAQAAEPITIQFWHYQTANRQDLTDIVKEFMSANPDIKVQEVFKDVGKMATEIQAASLVGRAPDVAQVLGRLTLGLTVNAKPVPLDSGPDKGAFLKEIAPNFLEIGSYKGHIYAVPHSFGTPITFINRDLFRQAGLDPDNPPRTWEELRKVARQIKEKTGKFGLMIYTSGRDVSQQQMLVNSGPKMFSDDFTHATFATADGIAAMQMWQDMAVTDKSLTIFTERENLSMFMSGQIGIMVHSSATLPSAIRSSQGVFDLGMAHFPTWGDKPRRVPNSGSALMMFSQDEKRREAAFRFMAHMMKRDITNRWAIASGYLPVAPGARNDEAIRSFIAKEPRWGVAVDQMDDLVVTARWPGSRVVEIQTVLENMVQALWQGKAPAATLVPAAEADVTRLIADGQ